MKASKESDSFLGDIVSSDEVTGQLRVVTEIHVSGNGPCRVLLGERMGKRVIIKTLKEENANDPQFLMMLRKEFEIGFSLSHPGIAATLDYQNIDGLGECILEEFIDGESLETLLQQTEIPVYKANAILKSIAETLTYIHKKGIVHADLKPSNIIISHFNDQTKIIDFGFADSPGYVSLKINGGTSGYIAPERREKDYKSTPESDIWSMGEIIDNLAEKIKSNDNRRLKRIAQECKKPLGERVQSAEQLLKLLEDSEGNQNHSKSVGFVIASILACLSFIIIGYLAFRNSENKEEIQIVPPNQIESEATESENSGIEENLPVSVETITKDKTTTKDNREDINESSKATAIKGSDKLPSEEKEEGTDKKTPEPTAYSEYLKMACDFANQHIQDKIEEIKEKGLYKKATTFGEFWNSRYVYDQIISEIKDYVDHMPIDSNATRVEVKEAAVNYARKLLADEEKKLEDHESRFKSRN